MGYSNSPLVSYTKLSPNHSGLRNHQIDIITIHCMAGDLSVESCGSMFAKKERQASSNYGIGSDGRIALYVEEKNRSWCTSSSSNDNRAITIEVASGAKHPYEVSDKALAALVQLCADICKRNGIAELKWKNDKSLIGKPEQQNMTIHQWFANKACPGQYLLDKHPYIVQEVNKILNGSKSGTDEVVSMTKAELKAFIEETVKSMGVGGAVPTWAEKEYKEAIEKGLTDGSNPMKYATRLDVMLMTKRAVEK